MHLFHPEYCIINSALSFGKPSADGNGTGHVCTVISKFCPDIHENQISLHTNLFVFYVVQNTSISSRGDDRLTGKSLAPVSDKFMDILRFDFIFGNSWFHKKKNSPKSFLGDITRYLHLIDFSLFLDCPQLMHQRHHPVVVMKRKYIFLQS